MALYKIYDFKVSIPLDLGFHASKDSENESGSPDISISIENRTDPSLQRLKKRGQRLYSVKQAADYEVISSNDGIELVLKDKEIHCTADPRIFDGDSLRLEILGTAMPMWLERMGIVTFHAAGIESGGKAFVLLADSGEGKSTLTAHLINSCCRLLADDVTAVDLTHGSPMIRPAYPQLRLWPGSAPHLKEKEDSYPRVLKGYEKRLVPVGGNDLGAFCGEITPLAQIYLLNQENAKASIKLLEKSPSRCLIELLRNSFVGQLLEASKDRPERLRRLGEIVRLVPMKELTYPTGFDKIHEVCDRILDDFHRSTG